MADTFHRKVTVVIKATSMGIKNKDHLYRGEKKGKSNTETL